MRFVERFVHPLDERRVLPELRGRICPEVLLEERAGEVVDGDDVVRDAGLVGGEELQVFPEQIVDALEPRPDADGPGEGPRVDPEFALQLVQEGHRVSSLPVQLVDEHHHRRVAHPADVHQFARLFLDTLHAIDDEDDAVHRGEGAVRVLGEILVARRVEDIDLVPVVLEAHHRRRHRDAALFLDLHEVGGGRLPDLVALHGAGGVDGAAEEEEFLGEGRFPGVGMADDAKRPASGKFSVFCQGEFSVNMIVEMWTVRAMYFGMGGGIPAIPGKTGGVTVA